MQKYWTKNECLKNIDINQFVLLSQDRDENKGNKVFYRLPLEGLHSLDLNINKNYYEILPPDIPVKPYFDLEMEEEEFEPNEMKNKLNVFIDWLRVEIDNIFDVTLTREDIIVLDSCRTNKLSYHLIINNHMCFKSVADHKLFVQYLWSRFLNPIGEKERQIVDSLKWTTQKNENRFIFDPIPYGKDQNVRMVNQSKKGKEYLLKMTGTAWTVNQTLIRLYNGIENRKIVNVEAILGLSAESNTTLYSTSPSYRQSQKNKMKNIIQKFQDNTFVTTGITLFEKNKLKLEEWEKLPSYKKYLYLIPNTSQHWDIYMQIGMAIKSAGGTKQDFKDWANLNTICDENDTVISKDFDRFRTANEQKDEIHNYDLPYLRRLAKLAYPEFFRVESECLKSYFSVNTSGMTVINESSQFVSELGTPDADNINNPAKVLILWAYLGRGKTTAIKRLLKEQKIDSYLFISPRQTFARFISGDFGIDCYLDGKRHSKRLVISVESLLKIGSEDYDCIILDESESILNQFSSHTTDGNHVNIWKKMVSLIKNAKKVVFADAFITNRSLDFARSFEENVVMIKNNTAPVTRTATEIHPSAFLETLVSSIKNGEKNYVCYSSVNKLAGDLKTLEGVAMENENMKKVIEKSIVYHAKTDDSVFQTLTTINDTWKEASLVMTSPTNTIGCSYSPEGDADFNQVMVCAAPTCCVRDTFQTQMRVRHLKDNKMVFSLPTEKSLQFSKSRLELQFDLLDEYETFNKSKAAVVMELINKLMDEKKRLNPDDKCWELMCIKNNYENEEDIPDALKKVLHFNLFESTLSSKHYKTMFYSYLQKCGYIKSSNENLPISTKNSDVPSASYNYENIEKIDSNQFAAIKLKIERKKATAAEKLQNEKYWFDMKINPSLPMNSLIEIFDEYYMRSQNRHIFDNAFIETKYKVENQLQLDQNKSGFGFELNAMNGVKLNYIKEINTRLGLTNSFQNNITISREKIENIAEYLFIEKKNISIAFSIREQGGNEKDFKHTITLIKKIYKNWIGTEFVAVEKKQKGMTALYTTKTALKKYDQALFK